MTALESLVARIVPSDRDAGALEAGTVAYVEARLANEAAADAPAILAGIAALRDLDTDLARHANAPWFRRLVELVQEGFYADAANGGNAGEVSWRMIGYAPRLPARPATRATFDAFRHADAADIVYDAIVVGAGAGGGIAAQVLAQAGKRVLLLERGDAYGYAASGKRDHLRNHRNMVYGHNTGPDLDGHPRVIVESDGRAHVVSPIDKRYHANAAGPGSGTAIYGGQAWRFHPDDFRMATRYGVPAESSLADWPIGYDDLASDYERAEWEIGVAGADAGHPAPRRRGYPMPPVPGYAARRVLQQGAARLGISTFAPPLLLNTVPRDGRAACVECGSCVGFACPSDAKNGTQNTAIVRALATGRCDLVLGATVARIRTGADGAASGIEYFRDGRRHTARARAVVLAAGAIETARLLLLSADDKHPNGIGNANDQVGRNLQGHLYPTAIGLFDDDVYDARGPGVTLATCDFSHGNPGIVGGGMLADDFIVLPTIFWNTMLPPDVPRWGAACKDFMRNNYRRVLQVRGPVQEIPNPLARVTLDAVTKDRSGLPVARLSGTVHDESLRTAAFMRDKAQAWLAASGARRIWTQALSKRLSGGQHQAGTCRMGSDPQVSVCDSFGRVWGCPNLAIADTALHPTNGGFNPALTAMALAFRVAHRLGADL